ncbi:hypothetical protein MBLNU459_g7673t2 [Dothideomycetes sp. NU459]
MVQLVLDIINKQGLMLSSLFNDPLLSDVTLKFSGTELKAHKAILAHSSRHFRTAFNGNLKTSSNQVIDLGDGQNAKAVRGMIRHCYNLAYDETIDDTIVDNKDNILGEGGGKSTIKDLIFHIDTFVLANKYDVPSLRILVIEKLEKRMLISWKNPEFADAVKAVWSLDNNSLVDPALRDLVLAFCSDRMPSLIKIPRFVDMIEKEEPFLGKLLRLTFDSGRDGGVLHRSISSDARNLLPQS